MQGKESTYLFDERIVRKLPVYMRFMEEIDVQNTDELYLKFRFSESQRHNSKNYINRSNHKPQSRFLLGHFLKQLT